MSELAQVFEFGGSKPYATGKGEGNSVGQAFQKAFAEFMEAEE